MYSYRVYLTDMKYEEKKYEFKNKEEVRECVNKANKDGFFRYKIIVTFEGTDVDFISGRFSNKDERLEIPRLDDEWRIQDGQLINYTKYLKYNAEKEATQGGNER